MRDNAYLKQLLTAFLAAGTETAAFSIYDGSRLTRICYGQFARDILKMAGYFKSHGIHRRHIALAAANSYQWLVAFFAITASGNVAVLLNPLLSQDILLWQCKKADVSFVCGDASVTGPLQSAQPDLPCIPFAELETAAALPLEEVHQAKPEDTLVLLATSGTTGESKFVEFTCTNLQTAGDECAAGFSDPDLGSFYLILPLFHVGGLVCTLSIFHQCKLLCMGRGPMYMFSDMAALNPAMTTMVPSMMDSLERILRNTATPEGRQKYIGSNLKLFYVGAAVPKPSVCHSLMKMGIRMATGYGLTESAGIGHRGQFDEQHLGTIGKTCGSMQACIRNGEILLKGKPVMKGYYKDPAATARIMENGWLHTGDLGYCDGDGYYYITGRKKNVIILSNGENVNPEEIEAKFSECPHILECMVYSDSKGIRAEVYTQNEDSARQFIRAYNDTMPTYRQVYKVEYTAVPLEKTGSGKIKRKENRS